MAKGWQAVIGMALLNMAGPAIAETVQATASARILTQVTVTVAAPVQFGSIIPDDTATGYVSIETEGTVSECSASRCLGIVSPATFVIDGTAGQVVTISHAGDPANPVTFSMTDGTNSTTFGLILNTPVVTLNASGRAEFNVGARIMIPAGLPAGDYSGQFEVTVNYQ